MIKWAGYGELLKLSFFGLLISFFTLFVGSSVNAGFIQDVGIDKYPSSVDNNYKLGFLKGGGLLTDYLAQAKSFLAFKSDTFFRRSTNGQPYFYNPHFQGYFGEYRACDEITGVVVGQTDYTPTNCTSTPITGDYNNLFKAFFSKVKQGDFIYYDFYYWDNSGPNGYNRNQGIHVCWSSNEIGSSICFRYTYGSTSSGPSPARYGSLVNSQNFSNLSYGLIANSWLGYAPGQNGYMGDFEGTQGDGSYGNVDGFITGSVFQQVCTVGYAKNYAENLGLSSYLCYGGLPLDSDGLVLPIAGTGASVFEIYNASKDGKNFQTWFQYWQNIYIHRLVYDSSVWSGVPAPLYSYFNFVSQYGSTFTSKEIQDYCRIILNNMDLNSSWHGNSSWCPQVYGNGYAPGGGGGSSNWSDDIGTGIVDNNYNNNVNISVNWDGVGNHSGNEVKTPSAYIQDFFNKAREVIPTNFTDIGGGFLPTYILTFLCAIILFRFLRH